MKVIKNDKIIDLNAFRNINKVNTAIIGFTDDHSQYWIYEGDNADEVFAHLVEFILAGKEFYDLRDIIIKNNK